MLLGPPSCDACREPQRKKKEVETAPAVTHIRLKMKGAPASRSGGALRIYDVSINERDPSARQV